MNGGGNAQPSPAVWELPPPGIQWRVPAPVSPLGQAGGLVSWGLLNDTMKTQLTCLGILFSDTGKLPQALEVFFRE